MKNEIQTKQYYVLRDGDTYNEKEFVIHLSVFRDGLPTSLKIEDFNEMAWNCCLVKAVYQKNDDRLDMYQCTYKII